MFKAVAVMWGILCAVSALLPFLPAKWSERFYSLNYLPKLPWYVWVIGFLTLAILVVFEGGHRQLESQKAHHRAEMQKAAIRPLPTAADWKDLASRFAKLNPDARADWNRTGSGEELWHICGGGNIAELKALCGLAGAILVKSPQILIGLPEAVLSQGDPAIRWLVFLKESGIGRMDDIVPAIETGKAGETRVRLAGSINHLSSVSSSACIHCTAQEI